MRVKMILPALTEATSPLFRPVKYECSSRQRLRGPGEDTWPRYLADLAAGHPAPRYESRERTLAGLPPIRRDLIDRRLYLVPNSIVVSRGCPHVCDFCYKEAFFEGGRSF